jgi:hypothetical protein
MKDAPQRKKLFVGKLDVFIVAIFLAIILVGGLTIKLVLQKDTYITVEMLASGGEWWWGTAPPYYWNISPLSKGMKELDVTQKPLVEVLDVVTYGTDNRKFVWMKARLKVKKNVRTNVYTFKQTEVQVGKTLTIAPNNIMLIAQVISVDGMKSVWNKKDIVVVGKMTHKYQWEADAIEVGDVMKDNNGDVVAEILDKQVAPHEAVTVDWRGEPLLRLDPYFKDITVTIKLRVIEDGVIQYFNFYQPVQPAQEVNIQFSKITIQPVIMRINP